MEISFTFWNVQNNLTQQAVLPEELNAELADNKNKKRKTELDTKKLSKAIEKLYTTKGINHRKAMCDILRNLDSDLVAIAELAVTSQEAAQQAYGTRSSVAKFDHFSMYNYVVSLDYYEAAQPRDGREVRWQTSVSPVNCEDARYDYDDGTKPGSDDTKRRRLRSVEDEPVDKVHTKNTLLEMYGIIWAQDKLVNLQVPLDNTVHAANLFTGAATPEGQNPIIRFITRNHNNVQTRYYERRPGWAVFADKNDHSKKIVLIMHHNLWGGRSMRNRTQKRKDMVTEIARSRVVTEAIKRKIPIVIAGDFNLDHGTQGKSFKPITDLGFATRIGNQKASPVSAKYVLSHSYDQIFTKGFSNPGELGQAYNFAEHVFQSAYATASQISDHLPVNARLKL